LAGATGYIGSRVVRELLNHNFTLLCPIRDLQSEAAGALRALADPLPTGRLGLVCANLQDPQGLAGALADFKADAVVSCIASRSGGAGDSEAVEYRANLNLLRWALDANAKHFTLLSAICVQKPRLAFQFAKLRFEAELAASGIPFTSVRATAFFKSLSGQVKRVQSGKPFLMFGDGQLTRCKPIAEADLAQYIRLSLESQELLGIRPIGGPGPAISPLQQARLLADLTDQAPHTRSVNPKLLTGVAKMLSLPGRFSATVADKAEFARIGHYYATESMLHWDEKTQTYDADATPEFGSITLEESYRAQLAGSDDQDLKEHALFR